MPREIEFVFNHRFIQIGSALERALCGSTLAEFQSADADIEFGLA